MDRSYDDFLLAIGAAELEAWEENGEWRYEDDETGKTYMVYDSQIRARATMEHSEWCSMYGAKEVR